MSGSLLKGRKRAPKNGQFSDTISERSADQAMLLKLDEIIDLLSNIQSAISSSTDGDTLQAALNVASITAAVEKIRFR